MKNTISAFILSLLLTVTSFAQEVGVKVDHVDASEGTTISIRKGDTSKNKKKYELSEGAEEISGDKDVLKKTAEINWKKACDDFKKEIKKNNKDNKIVSISCGKMHCAKEGVESSCQSNGKYKIRVLVEE
ncbi:MAG: hypothetical protein WA160_08875 [Pseudobdellovibrio sp.]